MHMFLLGGHSCWEELPVGKQGGGHLPGGLVHPISHRDMLVAVGGVRQGTQGTL